MIPSQMEIFYTMKSSVKLDTRTLKNLIKRAKQVNSQEIRVGFFEEDIYPDGTPVAQVVNWQETGAGNYPERPFFLDTMLSRFTQALLRDSYKDIARAFITSKGDTTNAMKASGTLLRDLLKEAIDNYEGHNSESWIAHKGFDDPLVYTGKMLNSVKVKLSGIAS